MKNRRRWSRTVSQILVWVGDEPLVLSYDGAEFWVPPLDKVAKVGSGSPYRFPSAVNAAGVSLPGTVLLQDQIVDTDEGGHRKVFDVMEYCAFLERDCPHLFARGFNVVTDAEDVRDVQLEGRPLYEESLDQKAQEVIEGELARRKHLEESGRPITAPSNEKDVVWAFKHKQRRGTQRPSLSTDQLFAAASGQFAADAEAPTVDPVRASAASLLDDCEALGINLTKTELVALLRDDQEQVAIVVEKIALKKQQAVGKPASSE